MHMTTILVIHDQKQMRSLLRAALEGDGRKVLEASNGRLGLGLHREQSTVIIVTDILIPEMNGFELIGEFTRSFPDVKIIAMSGGMEMEDEVRATKLLEARQTLQKPLDIRELLTAVRDQQFFLNSSAQTKQTHTTSSY
jgi:DNA-binding NtrC family response regulator